MKILFKLAITRRPGPAGGACSAPPHPLAGFRGLLLRKGREGTGGEGRGGEGREALGPAPTHNFWRIRHCKMHITSSNFGGDIDIGVLSLHFWRTCLPAVLGV